MAVRLQKQMDMITLGSGKPDANDLNKLISEKLIQYEKSLAILTNKLEQVIEKIECLTDKLLKLSENLAKVKER
jgi:hypothetical protein